MARGRSRDDVMARYLQHRVREQVKSESERSFAGRSKLSPAAINGIKNEGKGVGPIVIRKLAKVFGLSIGELYEAAELWAVANPEQAVTPAPSSAVKKAADGTNATPEFEEAVRFLAHRVSPVAIERVRAEAQQNDAAHDVIGWMRRLVDEQVANAEETSEDFLIVEEAFKPPTK